MKEPEEISDVVERCAEKEEVVVGVRAYAPSAAETMSEAELAALSGKERKLANLKGPRRANVVVAMGREEAEGMGLKEGTGVYGKKGELELKSLAKRAAEEAERIRAKEEGAAQNIGKKNGMGLGTTFDRGMAMGPLMGMGKYEVVDGEEAKRRIYARKLPAEVYEYLSKGVDKNEILNDFWRIGQLPPESIEKIFLRSEKRIGVVHQLMAKCWLRYMEEANGDVLFKFADYLMGKAGRKAKGRILKQVGNVFDAEEVEAGFEVGAGTVAQGAVGGGGGVGDTAIVVHEEGKTTSGGEFTRPLASMGVRARLAILARQRAVEEDAEVKAREEADYAKAKEEEAAQADVARSSERAEGV